MEQILIVSLITAAGLLGGGVGLSWAHREVMKKRNDYRMGQALRRGLNPQAVQNRVAPVVQWQTCESISAR